MKIQFNVDASAYAEMEKLRQRCGYKDLAGVIMSALALKIAVDEQFNAGNTAIGCFDPLNDKTITVLKYTPSSV